MTRSPMAEYSGNACAIMAAKDESAAWEATGFFQRNGNIVKWYGFPNTQPVGMALIQRDIHEN
jgi:hypothetical protein